MKVGDAVVTPDGQGTITGIEYQQVEVRLGSGIRRYDLSVVDLKYQPLEKAVQQKLDNAVDFITGIDAHRLLSEYKFNPYVLASSTKIKIFPHQINEVIWGLDNPRIMIADEVGLGKTIVAALIVSEIRARGMSKKMLFVVPKSLQLKWKSELVERFDIPAVVLDAEFMRNNNDPFGDEFAYVASMDYLKQPHITAELDADIDVVVVDEAHKMKKGNRRMKLGQHLAQKTNVLILLTATPHDGHDEDFIERLKLLDTYVTDVHSAARLWARTVKENVVDIEGLKVFPKRISKTVDIPLRNNERGVVRLLEEYFNLIESSAVTQREQSAVRFLRHTYRKRASSSLHSLQISLDRRLVKLKACDKSGDAACGDGDGEDQDDVDFEDREIDDGFKVTLKRGSEEGMIKSILKEIDGLNFDSKVTHLIKSIKALKSEKHDAKLVVFSEYRDTLDYLKSSLKDYKTGRIDGTMSVVERERALENFKKPEGDEILLCTDAAGEGIDMQFCNVEINYDLPWNPNKLEQRMGRIHRIGQDQNVSYYNFVVDSKTSIDGYIMRRLLDKIENIKESMGEAVYDVVGMLINNDDIGKYYDDLRQLPHDQWEPKTSELLSSIEATRLDIAEKRKMLMEGHRLDVTGLDTIQNIRKAAVVIDEVRRFMHTCIEWNGGTMKKIHQDSPVYCLHLEDKHAQRLNIGEEVYGVFDPDVSQKEAYKYLALGQPVVNAMLIDAASDHAAALGHENQSGVLCVYKIIVLDRAGVQKDAKIMALFERADGVITEVDVRSVWTYKNTNKMLNVDALASAAKRIEQHAIEMAHKRKDELDKRLSDIKRKAHDACTAYYAHKVGELEDSIRDLEKSREGPHVEVIVAANRDKISALKNQMRHKKVELNENYVTRFSVVLIGIAQVTPDDGSDVRIKIDRAGMNAVMQYERERAPNPVAQEQISDRSTHNCGYDVESFDRKIEVKSHRTSGSIILTDHEWQTAHRLRDEYWIYVVERVFEKPQITMIRNPSAKFANTIEKIKQNQFQWIVNDWKSNDVDK